MILDSKLAGILSNFCLDIAKAFFAVTFITPSLGGLSSWWEVILVLTKGMAGVTIAIILSWQFAKLEEKHESN